MPSGIEAQNMKDDEARYLIDQFNKYASWSMRGEELRLMVLAPGFAIIAIGISIFFYEKLPWSAVDTIVISCLVIVVAAVVLQTLRRVLRTLDSYEDNRRRLLLLEDYRSMHEGTIHALPDSVTFKKIVESKPDELEKLLKESEPNPVAPQT
jgi:hypothetical protein